MDPEKKSTEPQPIELKAVYYPDGKLSINCPLMTNPMLMRGFVEMIRDGVSQILAGQGERDKPLVQKPGGIMNFVKKRF